MSSNDNASSHGSGTPSGEGHPAHDPRSASSLDVADFGEATNSAAVVRPATVARKSPNGYVDPGVPSSSMASGLGEATSALGDLYADSPPRPFSRNVYEDTTSVFNQEFREMTPRGRPQRVYGEPHYHHHGFEQENDELREMFRDAYLCGSITKTEYLQQIERIGEQLRRRQIQRRRENLADLASERMDGSSRAAGAAALESTAIVETNTGTSDSPSVVSSGVAGGTTAPSTSTAFDVNDASTEDVHNTGFVASAQGSPNASVAAQSSMPSTTSSQQAESRDCSLDLMCGKDVVTGEDAENFCVQLRFRPRNQDLQPAEIEPENASTNEDDGIQVLSLSFAQIGLVQEEEVKRIEVDDDSSRQIEASTDSSLATEVAMQQLADFLAVSVDSASTSNIEGTKDDPMLGEIEDLPDYEDVVRQAQEEAELDEMSASLANTSFFVEKDSDNAIIEPNKSIEAAEEIDENAEVDGTASFAHRTSFVKNHTEASSNLSNSTITGINQPEEAPKAMEIDEDAETSVIDQDVEEMDVDGNVEAEQTSLSHNDVESSVTLNGPSNSSTLASSNLNEEAVPSHSVLHPSAQPSPLSTQIAVVQEQSNAECNHFEVPILDISVQSTQPSEQQSIENDVQELSASITPNPIISSSEDNADTEMNQAEKEQNQLPSKTNFQNPSQPNQLVDAEPVQVHISATFADASSNTTSFVQDEQIQELIQQVSSIKNELSRLSSIEKELSLIREQSCKCNRAEAPSSSKDCSGQHSLENPVTAADQSEDSEEPEQNEVVAENPPVLPEIQLRAQMCVATGYINRRRSKIRVMPGIRSRLALLLPKFKQNMLQRAQKPQNVDVPVNTVDSNVIVNEQPENAAASSVPEQTNDQEVANVETAETSEPRIEQNDGANLDGAETKQAASEERPKLQLRTAKRLQELMARQVPEPFMPRPQSPAPFYDSDESCARRQREQEEIDAEMKSTDTDNQQSCDGNTKEVDTTDSDVTVTAQQKLSDDEASAGNESGLSTTPKKHVKRRLRRVPTPCHHPQQAKIIAQLKKVYMWCDGCNLPFAKRLIMSDDEPPTCPSCAENSDEEHPEADGRNNDMADNDELEPENESGQNEAHQEESGINGAGDTEAMADISDPEIERQESKNEDESLIQSVDVDEQLSDFADIPPPPTPIAISSVENVQLDYMSPPREDDDTGNNTFGDESVEKRPSSHSTDDLAHDSVGTPKRRSSNSSDDDDVPTKRPRHQLVVESSSDDEGSSNGGRPRTINRRIRRKIGRAMKRKKLPVKPQFGRLHHITELEGVNLPRASPVVNMEGLFLDDDTDLSAEKQVLVVSGDHFQAVLYECGIVVFIGYFDGASHGSALLREAVRQPVVLWHFSEDRIKSIAAGPTHLVLLGRSGRVYTIGSAKHGQLGVPKPKSYRLSSIRPHLLLRRVVVRGEEVIFSRILTIGNVTVAVTEEGAVYMCGEGYGYVFRRTN